MFYFLIGSKNFRATFIKVTYYFSPLFGENGISYYCALKGFVCTENMSNVS